MKSFSIRLLVALLVFCLAPGCAPDAHNADPTADEVSTPSGKSDDWGDASGPAEDSRGYPAQITSAGATFGGVIPADGALDIALLADEGDTVVMWLRHDG